MTPWKKYFDEINTDENGSNNFGPNCFFDDADAKKYFKSLEKHGAKVEVGDFGEEIYVQLPKNKSKREQIFLYVITTCPSPTETGYNKKKDMLELVWS